MANNSAKGHLAALVTILIWGTTFISTKVLLVDFQPIEILFLRFLMGLLALLLVYPHRLKGTTIKQESVFVAVGLCGVCLYYLLENVALTYTMASNVGVIISVAPFFTAILSHLILKRDENLCANFYIGFIVAMLGVGLISFNGASLQLNPIGDLLAVVASFLWACYSILTRIISGYGYPTVLTTRRVFFYGILFMIPALLLFNFKLDLSRFGSPIYLFNILFLGLGASALCFVTWNFAVKILGAVRTTIYIYLVPVITVSASVLVIHESFTWKTALGTFLALAGLLISERKHGRKEVKKMDLQNEKCVMVIDEHLPLGIIANTAAIMGITLGKKMPEVVGADVIDKTGNEHAGIIEFPIPILKGDVESIKKIREKLYEPDFYDLTVVDFSELAQGCKTYDEFIEKIKEVSEVDLNYFGIAICGLKKKVNKLTGSMPLL